MADTTAHSPRRIGLYPGTFDPITNGHLDVIARAARLLDKLVVGVAINTGKGPLFTIDERVELVRAEIAAIAARNGMVIEVLPFDKLLVDFAELDVTLLLVWSAVYYGLRPLDRLTAEVERQSTRELQRFDEATVAQARGQLGMAYGMLEAQLAANEFLAGDEFTIADCAAAPGLFFALAIHPWDEGTHPQLTRYYRALAHRPSFAKVIADARPYRQLFPLPWPDDFDRYH